MCTDIMLESNKILKKAINEKLLKLLFMKCLSLSRKDPCNQAEMFDSGIKLMKTTILSVVAPSVNLLLL